MQSSKRKKRKKRTARTLMFAFAALVLILLLVLCHRVLYFEDSLVEKVPRDVPARLGATLLGSGATRLSDPENCHRDEDGSDDMATFYDQLDTAKVNKWRHDGRRGDDGKTVSPLAVHRSVRGVSYQYRLIDDLAKKFLDSKRWSGSANILDAGCGLGAGAMWMKRKHPGWSVTGVSLSPVQVNFAKAEFAKYVSISLRSYNDLEKQSKYDLIYSIEALVHSPSIEETLKVWADHLNPGGVVVLVDDYLAEGVDVTKDVDAKGFKHYWVLPSLITFQQLRAVAATAGLVVDTDSVVDMSDDVNALTYGDKGPWPPNPRRKDFCHRGMIGGHHRQRLATTGRLRYLAVAIHKK